MSSLYHFVARSNSSKLILSENYQIQNRILNCLTEFQHQGINFLYENFEKHTSCILNLESGLGKTALVSVFLDAVLPHDSSRKCLIIVKNEERIINWQFHIDVLTNLSTKVIFDGNEIGKESVYIIKWDSLRSSSSLININFDCIIVDDRSDLLTNKICLAYLLRNYENKISLVISSNDVSLDLKQFHSILRLCGRLDLTYLSFKYFEDKFALPKISDIPDDRNALESYFLRREKIINFHRDFCLRRYRHQFEDQLPLCKSEVYKQSIKKWQETSKQFQFLRKPVPISSRNSIRSCQILSSSSDRDTEELFKSFLSRNEEEELNAEVTRITTFASENDSNDNSQFDHVLMSPLLFVPDTDDEKLEQTVSSTTKDEDNRNIIQPTPIKKNITSTAVKRQQKRLRTQNKNEISKRITRSMDRLTRSKSQKSNNLLDIETILKIHSINLKTLKKRTRYNNKITKTIKRNREIDDIVQVSSTISTSPLNTKQGKNNPIGNIVGADKEFLFNGQQFGDYINEVEFVENNNNVNNYSNSIYETQCDFSVGRSLILPDTNDIKIMTQSVPVITLSSSSDSSVDFTTRNKNKNKNSPSPDLFSTYDEFNITCSQKNQGKSYLHSLETNGKTIQQKSLSVSINKFTSKSNKLQNTDDSISSIDLVKEKTSVIDNSIMERNSLVRRRPSFNFLQQNNKITKYLCTEQVSSTSINDTSQATSPILPVVVESPKTPKRKIRGRSLKINSASKKSPHTTTSTTPNSLRSWLITPSSETTPSKGATQSTTKNTMKRRRLDKFFEN